VQRDQFSLPGAIISRPTERGEERVANGAISYDGEFWVVCELLYVQTLRTYAQFKGTIFGYRHMLQPRRSVLKFNGERFYTTGDPEPMAVNKARTFWYCFYVRPG